MLGLCLGCSSKLLKKALRLTQRDRGETQVLTVGNSVSKQLPRGEEKGWALLSSTENNSKLTWSEHREGAREEDGFREAGGSQATVFFFLSCLFLVLVVEPKSSALLCKSHNALLLHPLRVCVQICLWYVHW